MCKRTQYKKTSNTRIDRCIRPLIMFLKDEGYDTVASCCGHGKYPVTVVVKEDNGIGKPDMIMDFKEIPRQ